MARHDRSGGKQPHTTTRRKFLEGLAGGGVLTALGAWAPLRSFAAGGPSSVLRGNDFDLTVGDAVVNLTGRATAATVLNGSLPGPILRWREGETVRLRVRNGLAGETSIHWHGIVLPSDMDGVPGLSFHGIAPGETYTYEFPVRQNGTYWYHAHSGFQEQAGLYGAIVIDPSQPEPFSYDREHVILLSDWSDRDPLDLYRLLKRQPSYYSWNDRTLGDLVRDSKRDGLRQARAERREWSRMRMKPSDVIDVGGRGYTYLMNGAPPAANWTGAFEPGERVRLRIVNGSSMSAFDVRIPGLQMTVVAADGQYVRPVRVDEFRVSAAEVIDVLVEPTGADAFTIFAQSLDRKGFACGTLAAYAGARAPVPELDPVAYLDARDMGHGAHLGAGSEHAAAPASHEHDAGAHMNHGAAAGAARAQPLTHPASEARNPGVDMQAMAPSSRLDDPGVGLRDNGRRVLTYSDLRSTFPDPDGREPERTIELHLTGHMERFAWSFDGIPFSGSEPIELRYGERVRFVLVNDTMMEHPIHLHGLWSDLEDDAGQFLVRKHTVSMPPGARRSFRVTADAPGRWAFHCHLIFHMESGMFREVRVGEPEHAEHERGQHDHGAPHQAQPADDEPTHGGHDHAAH